MTTSPEVASASSASELRSRLQRLGSAHPDLGGDIVGSWDSVIVYLDAFSDTYPNAQPSEALAHATLDRACTSAGKMNCDREDEDLNGEFGAGRLDAMIGYSERLNDVLTHKDNRLDASRVLITAAPLGESKRAFLFTDALVQSRLCSSARCRDAAERFGRFYVSRATFTSVLLGMDRPTSGTPRYLLPSTSGALRAGPFGETRYTANSAARCAVPSRIPTRAFPRPGMPASSERR